MGENKTLGREQVLQEQIDYLTKKLFGRSRKRGMSRLKDR